MIKEIDGSLEDGQWHSFAEIEDIHLTNNFSVVQEVAEKLANPRILQISLKTFRHWKGTTEAYKIGDVFHVQRMLRHKNVLNTQRYIHRAETILGSGPENEYATKVATTLEEYCKLLETGFTYVSDYGDPNVKILKKRK